MDIYNMEPAWVGIVEETKERLGRDLTGEEITAIRDSVRTYATGLGMEYNMALNLDGRFENNNGY